MQAHTNSKPTDKPQSMFSLRDTYLKTGALPGPSMWLSYLTQPALALVMLIALALIDALGGKVPALQQANPAAKTTIRTVTTPVERLL